MEGSIKSSVDDEILKRVNKIFELLDECKILEPNNFTKRISILETLYAELSPRIDEEDRKRCEEVITIAYEEINKRNSGQNKTKFFYLAQCFERELRLFIHENITHKKRLN